ncbi:MAG: tRNA (guanosine(37)-N1)-methyltransferase TrmD [Campylobacterota bacterium]|nr:tRNA (guanosine(37)-N1)-methyltransferase TrmD [Campylobacterota bacterium]
MKFFVLSIFPNMFQSPFSESIIKRAQEKRLVEVELVDIRDFTLTKHRQADDYPYGGGCGMVLKPEPVYRAMDFVKEKVKDIYTILLTPQGEIFHQEIAKNLVKKENIALICGRYEGFDERIRYLADMELSIGRYILSGGEIAAMVIIDAVTRLIPNVIENPKSLEEETFCNEEWIEYPQYTRPYEFREMRVPDILLTGNHEKIREWRMKMAKRRKNEKYI